MSTQRKSFLDNVGSLCSTFAAAVSVSAAVDGRRRPSPRDLNKLGIDAGIFDKIRRF
jgi:hypothetical protein